MTSVGSNFNDFLKYWNLNGFKEFRLKFDQPCTTVPVSIATASCLSVRLSVTLRYHDHIGWNIYFENYFTSG